MATKRSYVAGRFACDLDGQVVGFVKSVSGGVARGEVVTHNLGTSNVQKKHLATIVYEPFTVEFGMGMSKGFYDWIAQSFRMEHARKSGEIISADFDYKAQASRVFYDALITEVTCPALDGSSKEPAYMTLKFEPETIRFEKRGGERIQGKIGPAQKQWLCSNFRIEIGDLPCQRVSKCDSFTWKQGIVKDEVGTVRDCQKEPAKIEVPNLKLSISMADYEPWWAWYKSFVIDGKCGESDEVTGAITFLGPDMSQELARVELLNVGIFSLEAGKAEANNEEVSRFDVELYVEDMKFEYMVKDA
jgi:hypothetical protein